MLVTEAGDKGGRPTKNRGSENPSLSTLDDQGMGARVDKNPTLDEQGVDQLKGKSASGGLVKNPPEVDLKNGFLKNPFYQLLPSKAWKPGNPNWVSEKPNSPTSGF